LSTTFGPLSAPGRFAQIGWGGRLAEFLKVLAAGAFPVHEVWALDFQFDVTTDGRPTKIGSIIDEHTRECLGGMVDRSAAAERLIARLDRLADAQRGSVPAVRGAYLMSAHICTPDGNGFVLERRGCRRTGHAGLGQYFISRQLVTRHRSVPPAS
jgi:hypothetical protein